MKKEINKRRHNTTVLLEFNSDRQTFSHFSFNDSQLGMELCTALAPTVKHMKGGEGKWKRETEYFGRNE